MEISTADVFNRSINKVTVSLSFWLVSEVVGAGCPADHFAFRTRI